MSRLKHRSTFHILPTFNFRNAVLATAMITTLATGCSKKEELIEPETRTQITQPIMMERKAVEPELTPSKQQLILEKIREAKKVLSDSKYECKKGKKSETIWIAAYDINKNEINYFQIQAGGRNSSSNQDGFQVIRRTVNGVNSIFEVTHPPDQIVLAIKICVKLKVQNGKTELKGAVYTPYCKGLGEMRLGTEGARYVRQKVNESISELKHAGVDVSLFENGTLTPDMILMMVMNEHMEQVRREGAPRKTESEEKEFVRKEMQRILTVIATNEENAYDYSLSNQGTREFWQARGLVQMIQSTYESLKRKYPSVKFPDNFFEATRDHKNAIKAAILLFLEDYRLLVRNGVSNGVSERELIEMLFAAYNCGGPRTMEAIRTHESAWNIAHTEKIERLSAKIVESEQKIKDIAKTNKNYKNVRKFSTLEKAARLGKMGEEAKRIANQRRRFIEEREKARKEYKESSISTEAEGYLLKLFYVRQVLSEGIYAN